MADVNEMIGSTDADGTVHYPATSISGNPNYERPPTQMHQLGGGRFVVLDIFAPPGFDTAGVLKTLKTRLAAAAGEKKVKPSDAG